MIKIALEWKILLVGGSYILIGFAALLLIFWNNPIWIGVLIASIFTWVFIGFGSFIFVIVPLIRFQSAPDLAKKNYDLELKIKEFEKERRRIINE